MQFSHACIESIGYVLPDEIVKTCELESRLEPLYRRLNFAPGMLNSLYGIHERRVWPVGTLPSAISTESAAIAIQKARIDPSRIGAVIHGSVCRDYSEPATACIVHDALRLPSQCMIYDVSSACLGMMFGILQIASMIELNHISAGLVVGTELSRSLVDSTVDRLVNDASLPRSDVHKSLASLTIGSASAAVVVAHERLSRTGNRIRAALPSSSTSGWHLCHSERDDAFTGRRPRQIETNSAALLEEAIRLTSQSMPTFLSEVGWERNTIDRTIGHQVGERPRRLMLESLGLSPTTDLITYPHLGNTGAASIPLTLAIAADDGRIDAGHNLLLLGSGSGVNVLMLALQWCQTLR